MNPSLYFVATIWLLAIKLGPYNFIREIYYAKNNVGIPDRKEILFVSRFHLRVMGWSEATGRYLAIAVWMFIFLSYSVFMAQVWRLF